MTCVSEALRKCEWQSHHIPDDDVQQDDSSNDRAFDEIVERERQDHGDKQDDSQTVGDLTKQNLPDCDLFAIFKLIGSIGGKAYSCLIGGKAMPIVSQLATYIPVEGLVVQKHTQY